MFQNVTAADAILGSTLMFLVLAGALVALWWHQQRVERAARRAEILQRLGNIDTDYERRYQEFLREVTHGVATRLG